MRIEASQVARITSGNLIGADCVAQGIAFDSRVLVHGQAFVAIQGDADGHEYLEAAHRAGAPFAIVQQGRAVDFMPCVEVHDTMHALATLATELVTTLPAFTAGRIVGITGSSGKTSTKDLVAAVLSAGFSHSHAPVGSFNNDIGVPITILTAPDDCDALVLEMGMRGFGEIERLCNIAQPSIGVLTNIGDAHGERVGGREGIARAKFELLDSLPEHGVAVLNIDNDEIVKRLSNVYSSISTYGASLGADIRWSVQSADLDGRCTALFTHDGETSSGVVPFPGEHMVSNAAAAVSVGIACGMTLQTCVAALGQASSQPGRMMWRTSASGVRILDDSYNANTLSMMAALHVISHSQGHRIAVLGAMSEISDAEASHQLVADIASELGVVVLACETDLYGVPSMSVDQIVEQVKVQQASAVLVKGSRVSATDRVVDALLTA